MKFSLPFIFLCAHEFELVFDYFLLPCSLQFFNF
jgi:hypothetical protein